MYLKGSNLSTDINEMESNLDEMKKSLDMMKRRKRGIEQELIDLGVDTDKIKEVSGEVEERMIGKGRERKVGAKGERLI